MMLVASLSAALLSAAPAIAGGLPRSVSLGVIGAEADEHGLKGVRVQDLLPGFGGRILGLRPNDLILVVDGVETPNRRALVQAVEKRDAGQRMAIRILRNGKIRELKGKAPPKPLESFANGRVTPGEVPFHGGLLRDYLVKPNSGTDRAVVFLIPGYTCRPVETSMPEDSHRKLIDMLLAQGISTYRIEKLGVGDSRGGPDCADTGLDTEIAGFAAGYDALVSRYGYHPEQIFILGHSLGGIEAPLLVSARPVAGVAVYGTIVRNWQDYLFDLARLQRFIEEKEDPVAGYERAERCRAILQALFQEAKSPREIAEAHPELAELLRDEFRWDGGERFYDRHYHYWTEIAAKNLVKAWRDAPYPVLSLYGSDDVEVLSGADHHLIVDVVNHYRPGTARYVEFPGTAHFMGVADTPGEPRHFNPAIGTTLGQWILEHLAAKTDTAARPRGR